MIPMYNSLHRLLLLTIASAVAFVPAMAQPSCPEASPAPVAVPHMEELALLAKEMTVDSKKQQPDNWGAAYDEEKHKTFEKTYKVSKTDMLNFENKFGKVHVNTWNRNEVHVKVDIVARAGTENKAQEILNSISIVESRDGKMLSVRTNIESMRISGNGNRSFEVNYTIDMPAENPLTVKNSFGDVYLADLKGKVDVNVKYGALKCGRLSNTGNNVKVAYGSANCGYINGGNVNVAYGNMSLEGANGLIGSSKFSDFKLGSLGETMEMEVKYGSFRVDNISKNVRKIALDSGFTPISLNFEANTNFNFDVNVQFADFKYDKSLVNITSLEKGHTSAAYKGAFGGTSPKGFVSIESKYGEVKFTK
jgi:hypothetical protein